jgi:hypothetical protein
MIEKDASAPSRRPFAATNQLFCDFGHLAFDEALVRLFARSRRALRGCHEKFFWSSVGSAFGDGRCYPCHPTSGLGDANIG